MRAVERSSYLSLTTALAGSLLYCASAFSLAAGVLTPAIDMARFAVPTTAVPGPVTLQGRLTIITEQVLNLEILRDDYQFASNPIHQMDRLPQFSFRYVQDGTHLIPVRRGAIPSEHPMREYILEPGRIWQDPHDAQRSRISLPFALQERNANCIHNGVMGFTVGSDGAPSSVELQIASETCMYFKYNTTAALKASFQAEDIPQADTLRAAFRQQYNARLPTRQMNALAALYPEIDMAAFSGSGRLSTEDISLYGFVIDGVHYRGDCDTRQGPYPLCEEMSLPSYSLAKTLVAGLAAMRLEKLYPGSRSALITDYVPECNDGNWDDVTFEQVLNMLTGNFGSPAGRADEISTSTVVGFFSRNGHDEKISYACNAWPRKAKPGEQFAYHTTDTYLLGTAMNNLLKKYRGKEADYFDDLVLPLWQPLALSPATTVTRRSYDDTAQPFTGYGLTLLADDIARLAVALQSSAFDDKLDRDMFDSAMQRLPTPQGHYPAEGRFYYRHGFWSYDAQTLLGCNRPVMIPFMSGYGGISVVMMPNDTVYYIFSDGGKFAFTGVVLESHRIRSMCPGSI